MSEDIRVKMHEALRARMQAKGLEFPLPVGPLTVVMEDEITHTVAFPVCGDPECICYELEREDMNRATGDKRAIPNKRNGKRVLVNRSYEEPRPLNGNRPFQILK